MTKGDVRSSKREIWMINQYAITPDLPGGTRHYDFGCELVKKGYRVRIFASDVNLSLRRHTRLGASELWREEDVNGVQFIWVRAAAYQKNDWRRVWNMLSFAFNVCWVGVRLYDKPAIIIGSSPHPFAALGAWILAKLKHSRFILELRDLWPQALIDMGGMSEGSVPVRLLRFLERFLYRVAEKIIILASGSRDYLVKRGVASQKIVYIPNGVHLKNFQVGDLRVTEDLRDVENSRGLGRSQYVAAGEVAASSALVSELRGRFGFTRFTIIYTGAHGPANALDTILGAADLLRARHDIEFILVGDGPSKSALVVAAKQRGLSNVRFMDPVPKGEIPKLLAAADVAVIALRSVDAFSYGISPNKLFDYMAAAKPVICAVPGDMARLVEDSGAGISIPPENPEALAKAVEGFLSMSAVERAAMGKRGRDLVEREFSREKLAERLEEILTS